MAASTAAAAAARCGPCPVAGRDRCSWARLHLEAAMLIVVLVCLWPCQASTVEQPVNITTQGPMSPEVLRQTELDVESSTRSHLKVSIVDSAASTTSQGSVLPTVSPTAVLTQGSKLLTTSPSALFSTLSTITSTIAHSSETTTLPASKSPIITAKATRSSSKNIPSQSTPTLRLSTESVLLSTHSQLTPTNTKTYPVPHMETSAPGTTLASSRPVKPASSAASNSTLVILTSTAAPLLTTTTTPSTVVTSTLTSRITTLPPTTITTPTSTEQTAPITTTITTNRTPTSPLKTATTVGLKQTTTTSRLSTQSTSVKTTTDATTAAPTSKATSSSKATPIASSSTQPTIAPSTTVTPLNTSDAFKEFWVKTVISEDLNVDVSTFEWLSDMETRLAGIYDKGFIKLKHGGRRKRAAIVGETTLQMVNASRDSDGGKNVTMLYYMERYGNATPALSAVAAIDTFEVQEIALLLGKIIVVKAEVFEPIVGIPERESKLWLIGAVIGGVVGFILLVWCVLFIYCKCTRPIKTHQHTPRTPRSTRISMTGEYTDTNSYRSKMPKIQGFDIARTEVGLENEIQKDLKRKPGGTDSYRRHPDGSTELEGMYSTGEMPPPKPIGYTNTPPGRTREAGEGDDGQSHTPNRNKSRSHIPIDSSLRRSLPPIGDTSQETLHPPKKKSNKKKPVESEESDSEDDRSEDRKPLSPEKQEKSKKSKKKAHKIRNEDKARVKGKHKKKKNQSEDEDEDHELASSQAALYENVAKVTRGIGDVKLRSTQHAMRLPALISQPLVGDTISMSLREETELQESLQQKSDIERWRNKQRHRERTKGSKGSHRGHSKQARLEYQRAQDEICNFIESTDGQVPKAIVKKRKRKKKRSEVSPAETNKDDSESQGSPQHTQQNSIDKGQHLTVPQQTDEDTDASSVSATTEYSTDYSGEEEEPPPYIRPSLTQSEPTLEEARLRMHELVDNAFALISPYHRRRRRVGPTAHMPLPASVGELDNGTSNASIGWTPHEGAGPRHTPLHVSPATKMAAKSSKAVWSPYSAADQVAKLPVIEPATKGVTQQQVKPVRPVSAYNYINPAFVKDSSPESILETSLNQSSRSEALSSLQTARDIREAMTADDADYTSIIMDSRQLNPAADEDDDIITPLSTQQHNLDHPSDLSKRSLVGRCTNNDNNNDIVISQPTPNSLAVGDNLRCSQTGNLLQMLPEQLSLRMPNTDLTEARMKDGQNVLKRLGALDPEGSKLPRSPDEDEIDVIQRRVKQPGNPAQSNWDSSLRSELERLANRSSADTVISTTVLV